MNLPRAGYGRTHGLTGPARTSSATRDTCARHARIARRCARSKQSDETDNPAAPDARPGSQHTNVVNSTSLSQWRAPAPHAAAAFPTPRPSLDYAAASGTARADGHISRSCMRSQSCIGRGLAIRYRSQLRAACRRYRIARSASSAKRRRDRDVGFSVRVANYSWMTGRGGSHAARAESGSRRSRSFPPSFTEIHNEVSSSVRCRRPGFHPVLDLHLCVSANRVQQPDEWRRRRP
ncbi:hypothetical protein AZ78_3745 [Lysobacter capsici AZ78]|uniref:Uncharacterized protein n=1 Tax=Lysobacter capsici AZ78 TaxID=1444315 RepID=A0A108UBL4_9GAMM|nr:hypothetical protein AZ78_3745 [Lysobacter capsici AZ78]